MIASIATVKGREKECQQAEQSLKDAGCKVFTWKGKMNERTDDARKFAPSWKLHNYSGFILTCDDDLRYPKDYAEYMTKMCAEHGCPVSLMGRVVRGASESYYRDKGAVIKYDWRTADGLTERIHIPGTGVLCFHTDQVRFTWDDFPLRNAADINVGIKCNREGIPIMRVPPLKRNWLEYMEVPDTIYDRHRDNDGPQTEAINAEAWPKL